MHIPLNTVCCEVRLR